MTEPETLIHVEDQLVDEAVTAAVNTDGWSRLPVADRETKFAFRAATDRLAAHASSVEQFSSWFFWRDPRKPANNRNSYRMPFADVFDGEVKLVPAAVFSAAAQLAGAHGALPLIPEAEKAQIRRTIDRIYAKFRDMWEDPRQVPPWERESNSVADAPVKADLGEEDDMPIDLVDDEETVTVPVTAAVNSSGWSSYPIAGRDRTWDDGPARQRLQAWADGDMAKFRKGFLWYDAENAENLTAYKFPIADVVDGRLTIVPRAVNNAKARLDSADIPAADKGRILSILNRIQKRFMDDETVTAAMAPVKPPAAWFDNPQLTHPTRIRVTDEGRVYGHVAAWDTCHRGFQDMCLRPPRNSSDYREFKTGTTMLADGRLIKTGVLTYGGPHAPGDLNAADAVAFYADAGASVAMVNVGEDAWGIWVAGAMSPGTDEADAQLLRSHPLSGDWRPVQGRYELVAALAVNTPGFPIDEPQYTLTASGEPMSLVAAGIVDQDYEVPAPADVAELEIKAAAMQAAVDRRRQRMLLSKEVMTRRER